MVTVVEEHESGVRVVFTAEELLGHFTVVTYATQFGTLLATQTDARVATRFEPLFARLIARTSIT